MTKYRIKVKHPIYGVPITFLDQFNPSQFSIVAFRKGTDGRDLVYTVERESRMLFESANCKIPKCTTLIPGLLVGRCSRNTKTMEATIGDDVAFKRVLIQKKSTLSN